MKRKVTKIKSGIQNTNTTPTYRNGLTVGKSVPGRLAESLLNLKPKLVLSELFMEQVKTLHSKIRNLEWSGIIIYETLSGSISEEEWTIRVNELIPMDVGSHSYTEYDMSEEDEYSFDKYSDALIDGKKLGHCHTHHSMSCFFSGTDMSELHDNAGNHNYYLSLIVNYEDYTKWCAKVAFISEVENTEIYNVNKLQIKNSKSSKVLATMDCIISTEVDSNFIDEDFLARIDKLKIPKTQAFARGIYGLGHAPNDWRKGLYEDDDSIPTTPVANLFNQDPVFNDDIDFHSSESNGIAWEEEEEVNVISVKKDEYYTKANIIRFMNQWFNKVDPLKSTDYIKTLNYLNKFSENGLMHSIDSLERGFIHSVNLMFGKDVNDSDYVSIAVYCNYLLGDDVKTTKLPNGAAVKLVEELLYDIIDNDLVALSEITRLTGFKFKQ